MKRQSLSQLLLKEHFFVMVMSLFSSRIWRFADQSFTSLLCIKNKELAAKDPKSICSILHPYCSTKAARAAQKVFVRVFYMCNNTVSICEYYT